MSNTRSPAGSETLKRRYTVSTYKVLFGLSGNQCAHPDCLNTLIESGTELSDDLVTGHICHIYAISEAGPRGKRGLTNKELNSRENLILLCPQHHAVIDGQYEDYLAETLKEWKRLHEEKIRKRVFAEPESMQPAIFSRLIFATGLVDQEIDDEVDTLRTSRFFQEFNRVSSTLALGRRLVDGELCSGTDEVRSRALAWCARLLSSSETLDKAQELLELARSLGTGPEVDVAQAFIVSQQGDRARSLELLAGLDTPSSRSAALMVVLDHDGAERAIEWLESTGIKAADLDSDGKSFLLRHELTLKRWEAAVETLGAISVEDFGETPILHHISAGAKLITAVPTDFRAAVLQQVPFEGLGFPLASDAVAMEARRHAHRHFVEAVKVAEGLQCPRAGKIADEVRALAGA